MEGEADPSPARHVSVLPAEVLDVLSPRAGQTVVDATAGAGGHARLIADRLGPDGTLIVLDRDPDMLALARRRLDGVACRVRLVQANFDCLQEVLDEGAFSATHVQHPHAEREAYDARLVDGVLADLGICSDQLDRAERGFSFQQPGPLDMRMNPEEGEPARALLRRLNERDLADLFWKYGEERFSRRVARKIVEIRSRERLETTEQLAEVVRRCVPRPKGRHSIDPATRVFQALRIAVNDELGALERLLKALPNCLKPGGRAVLISFHSLEDRLVKRAFQDRETWQVLTRKPVQAGEDEAARNPRARSAKLRAAERKAPAGGRDSGTSEDRTCHREEESEP